ncbi:MAG: hydrogenase [Methanomassiliicoccaceae archaeon]|jgi:hydrogenase-4 component E|nr:hydrogenase [Methanomassiliicoccaceae archaeon]
MDAILTGNLIDLCAVAMLLLSLLAMAASRMGQLINAFAIQSLFLAALAFVVGFSTGRFGIFLIGGIAFGVKVIFIPWFLRYTSFRIKAGSEVDSSVGIPSSLLISAALIILSYFVTTPLSDSIDMITVNCLAISTSMIMIGLFMMATRKKAIAMAIGLLTIENGLFLGVLSISYGMPLLVEIGIFFDVVMVAVIVGIFAFRISETFNTIDVSFLRRLKD